MKKREHKNFVYQTKNGALLLRGDLQDGTIWATQAQIAELFDVQSQAITKHIKNIYKDVELDKNRTCSKMEQVQIEGKRSIKRQVLVYNLDMIISVGYRINSKQATQFRIWATKRIKEYLVAGFSINKKRVAKNYKEFLHAVQKVKALIPPESSFRVDDALALVELLILKTAGETGVCTFGGEAV